MQSLQGFMSDLVLKNGGVGMMGNVEKYLIGITEDCSFDINSRLKCPVCDFDCVHPEAVVVNAGGVITIIEDQIPQITRGNPTGRGVSIWLHFACENGHRWTERYQFHKGSTFKELVIDEPYNPGEWPRTIWRD
jgi:hypothetical protein